MIKITKPYIPETSSNKSAQTPSIIGAERPENMAGNISKIKIILPTFGTALIINARENIIVGQGARTFGVRLHNFTFLSISMLYLIMKSFSLYLPFLFQ